MPEHLRALVVIIALATAGFAFAKLPACAVASTTEDFERRRNMWLGITLAAFLAHDFWIYIVATAVLLLFALPREPNKFAMFFFLLFAVPGIESDISGLGLINYFFKLNYVRLLVLVILLPAFLSIRKERNTERFGRSMPDKFIAGYLILNALLILNVSTLTNGVRIGVFYSFLDVFLPYYVASRSLKNIQQFRDALMAFVVAAMLLSIVGAFEFARHWLLYTSLQNALGVQARGMGWYLERGEGSGLLRAWATLSPIALGYVIAVAMGFFVYLRRFVPSPLVWGLGLALLIMGIVAPVSRGPWVGVTSMLLVFIATSPFYGRVFAKFAPLAIVVLALLASPAGEPIRDYLPFIGSVEAENVTYRQRLIEISLIVMMNHPFFGSYDFLLLPQMQELYQGGMIDIVNTYVGIGLANGFVGLSLFLGFFIVIGGEIYKGMRSLADRTSELYLLGQVLLAVLVGILVTIGTVSSIAGVPVVYWSVAGLGVAYVRMLGSAKTRVEIHEAARPSRFQRVVKKNWQ